MNPTLPPQKRRALAPIDVNTRSPRSASRSSPSKSDASKQKPLAQGTATSRVLDFNATSKRPAVDQENDGDAPGSVSKKRRLSDLGSVSLSPSKEMPARKDDDSVDARPRSHTPDDNSGFDSSCSTLVDIDTSRVTGITEPDVDATAAAVPAITTTTTTTTTTTHLAPTESRPSQGGMTREEARRKAEILRLRLGLASYKVKTNQADVPLDQLQVRPIPGRFATRLSLPPRPVVSPRRALPTLRPDAEGPAVSWARSEGAPSPTPSEKSAFRSRMSDSAVAALAHMDQNAAQEEEEPELELPPLPPTMNRSPQRITEQDAALADSERGGAAEGLLSLSQGSPGPCLK